MPGQKTCTGCNTPLQDGWKYCPQCALLVMSDEEREAERLNELVSAYFKSKPKPWGLMTVAERGEILYLLKAVRVIVASEEDDGRGSDPESEEVARRWKNFLHIATNVPPGYQAALGNAARLLVESEVLRARRGDRWRRGVLEARNKAADMRDGLREGDDRSAYYVLNLLVGELCELAKSSEPKKGGQRDHGEGAERDDNEG